MGNELYAIRREADSTTLSLVFLDINDITNEIYKANFNVKCGFKLITQNLKKNC